MLSEALHLKLLASGQTIAVAEASTAGLLSLTLAGRPGSSRFFRGGVIAYGNEVKTSLLDIDPAIIAEHGAVSAVLAETLAEAVKAKMDAQVGLAETAVLGPGGGSVTKPIGTGWVALALPGETIARRVPTFEEEHLTRENARYRVVDTALALLAESLEA